MVRVELTLLSDPSKSANENLAANLGDRLKSLKYDADPEIFFVHACLIDDWGAQTVLRTKSEDCIDRNWGEMRRRLDRYWEEKRISPHPGRFCGLP